MALKSLKQYKGGESHRRVQFGPVQRVGDEMRKSYLRSDLRWREVGTCKEMGHEPRA